VRVPGVSLNASIQGLCLGWGLQHLQQPLLCSEKRPVVVPGVVEERTRGQQLQFYPVKAGGPAAV
jgi:hypothetical protein